MKNIPHPKQTKPIKRSASGLRESLFDMLELLRAGEVDVQTAKTYALLSMTIIKATEMQLQYEKMRLDSEVPSHLTDMSLVPPIQTLAFTDGKEPTP